MKLWSELSIAPEGALNCPFRSPKIALAFDLCCWKVGKCLKFSSITSTPFLQPCFTEWGGAAAMHHSFAFLFSYSWIMPQGLSEFLTIKYIILTGKSGYLFTRWKDGADYDLRGLPSGSVVSAAPPVAWGGRGWPALLLKCFPFPHPNAWKPTIV